ncbi:hypothetical protein F5888DRAFT_1663362 [Russula emetica]|nr:hypothetical protein F5888DRAFT_1663362 [Russula emetica]
MTGLHGRPPPATSIACLIHRPPLAQRPGCEDERTACTCSLFSHLAPLFCFPNVRPHDLPPLGPILLHLIAHVPTPCPCRLHGGRHANYCKWYFVAQLDIDDAVGYTQDLGLQRLCSELAVAAITPRSP